MPSSTNGGDRAGGKPAEIPAVPPEWDHGMLVTAARALETFLDSPAAALLARKYRIRRERLAAELLGLRPIVRPADLERHAAIVAEIRIIDELTVDGALGLKAEMDRRHRDLKEQSVRKRADLPPI